MVAADWYCCVPLVLRNSRELLFGKCCCWLRLSLGGFGDDGEVCGSVQEILDLLEDGDDWREELLLGKPDIFLLNRLNYVICDSICVKSKKEFNWKLYR